MANRIILNETSYFGPGAISVIPEEICRRNFEKAFIVTDKDLVKFGIAKKVTDVLDQAKISYELYDNVKANPTIENVQTGVKKLAASGADVIVAIGGGSAIDTAKGIGIIATNPEFADVKSLEGVADTKAKSLPIIAVATTAGTAAEVTINYVITDEQAVKKMVCVDPNDIPIIAIVDPELMVSMPKGLTASTGMDALTHAIEGYITRSAWTMTDMFELKAIELIAKHLPTAVAEPNNMEARDGMALAQYIAGMGFSNVGLGIVHSMAHPLGAFYDTPHGVANALLLPYVMEYNAPATGEKYREIAKALGVTKVETMDQEAYRKAAVEAVIALSKQIDIPQKLSEIGVKEKDLPQLAKSAFADVCTPGNPRDTSEAEILALYQKAFK
ncbi:MAG: lactaldehyde reductase [Firmicutes bacterium]|nr:lactaldehyde reductase [Bacillota bacterium]